MNLVTLIRNEFATSGCDLSESCAGSQAECRFVSSPDCINSCARVDALTGFGDS